MTGKQIDLVLAHASFRLTENEIDEALTHEDSCLCWLCSLFVDYEVALVEDEDETTASG